MADALDKQIVYADVYAHALFEIARGKGQITEMRAELDEFTAAVAAQPDFGDYLASAAVDNERRGAFLEKSFRGRLSDDLLNTLLVMNRNDRAGLIAALQRAFVLRQEEAAGEVEVTVVSAVELSAAQRSEIERTAAEVSGKKPLTTFVVHPEIVGGLIVQIGDLRFDNSIARHLEIARRRLLERAERGIQVGVA